MRLERDSEFWQIDLDDRSYVIRSGRVGTRGKSARVTCPTVAEAMDAHDLQIVTMLKAGWTELPNREPALAGLEIRDPALEQAIVEHKDDRDTYAVYADWLQAAGNPVGELVALAIRLDLKHDARISKRIDAMLAALRLPLPDQATFRFRWGLWRSVRIENMRDLRDGPSTALPFRLSSFVRALFGHVLCCALDELAIGALQWRHNYALVPQVVEEAGHHAWARGLRTLDIGEIRSDPDPPYYASDYDAGKLGRPITHAFPNLAALRIHAGFQESKDASSLEGLALPRLKQLAIVAGWCGEPRLEQLATMTVPALERLELWAGGPTINRTVDARQLRAMFERGRFAKLRHLALCNSPYADELAATIPGWTIASRLNTLDLSKGTLTDDGARALLVPGLPALQHLVVDECFVSPDVVRALAARYARVSARGQRTGAPIMAFRQMFSRPYRRR